MARTLTPDQARAMALTKARRRLRTHVNSSLHALDVALDAIEAAQLPRPKRRQPTVLARLTTQRTELEAVLQDLPTE